MGRIIGIDLGTTNSVVATVDGPRPRVLENKDGQPLTPSAVSWRKKRDEFVFGATALDNLPMDPKNTITSIKRLMGRAVSDPEVQKVKKEVSYEVKEPLDGTKDSVSVVLAGKEYSPVEISAMILRKLKEDAEFRLGEEVTHAVITVPAYFSQIQRDATRKAGMKAGLKVIKILDEPTAAAIAFGLDSEESSEPKTLLVYDFGGGTFDISVLMWAGNVFAPMDKEGDMWLGGDNFDQLIVDYAIRHIEQEYDVDPRTNIRFMAALKKSSRDVKERLSSSRSADLIIAAMLQDKDGDPIDLDLTITREEFERMIKTLVDRTVSLVDKALENAKLTEDDVDYVLMAGNSTCVPLVQKAMEDRLGREKVLRKINPKQCVALGAATLAARVGGIICENPDPSNPDEVCGMVNELDATKCVKCGGPLELKEPPGAEGTRGTGVVGIASFHYGTQSAGDKFNIFIQKSAPYPTPTQDIQTLTFRTQRPNQRIISIPVYGGDNLDKASKNEKQGEAFAVLPPLLPESTPVRISLWLDSDEIFDLSAHLEDGTDLQPTILKGGQIQKIVEQLQELLKKLAEVKEKNPEKAEEFEAQIEKVLGKIKGKEDEPATVSYDTEVVEIDPAIIKGLEDALPKSDVEEQAEDATRFAQFVIHEYGWALNPNQAYELNKAVEQVNEALQARDTSKIEEKAKALNKALDNLPDIVKLLLGLKGAIGARIRPIDPVKADELNRELEGIEQAFKSKDFSAQQKLMSFIPNFERVLREVEASAPTKPKCPVCGLEVSPGQRYCPNRHDLWLVR